MGVTYKISKDVIDFITEIKQENPNFSCRKMVNIIWERFQIKLSKSSVNAIIKNAHLSSPIGRRSEKKASPKKFQIPANKISQALPGGDTSGESPRASAPIIPKEEQPKPHNKKDEIILKIESARAPLVVSTRSAHSEKLICDGMGSFFLKAIEWEMSRSSLLGDLLKKHVKGADLIDLDTVGNILTYLPCFGLKDISSLNNYSQQGLWALSGTERRINSDTIKHIISNVEDISALTLALSIELPGLLTEIAYFSFYLEDGTKFWLDGELCSVWTNNEEMPFKSYINKSMNLITSQIINNVQSVVLCSGSAENKLTAVFYDLILAFENMQGKRIEKIGVIDRKNNEIAIFSSIPNMKRDFICGVWPWQDEFEAFISSDKITKVDSFYVPHLQRDVYFREINISLENGSGKQGLPCFRGIILRNSIQKAPFLSILTNISGTKAGAEEIISRYLSLWPNLEKGIGASFLREGQIKEQPENPFNMDPEEDFEEKLINSFFTESCDIFTVSEKILEILNHQCQKRFFPRLAGRVDLETMLTSVYRINGSCVQDTDRLTVHLGVFQGSPLQEDIIQAALKINESQIFTTHQRQLFVSI